MLHVKLCGVLSKESNLKTLVEKTLPEIPREAHGVFVGVHLDGMGELQSTLVIHSMPYPVRFYPVDDRNPVGTVTLCYGVGNLESMIVLGDDGE